MDTYPRTWSSPTGMTCYRIVDPGDPDHRYMEWCPGENGAPVLPASAERICHCGHPVSSHREGGLCEACMPPLDLSGSASRCQWFSPRPPTEGWRRLDDNVAACCEILRLAEENAKLKAALKSAALLTDEISKEKEAIQSKERARIRRELRAWLIGDILPEKDAGLVNGRRIVDEIERICPGES